MNPNIKNNNRSTQSNERKKIEYNSTRSKLKLPEYGRLVQNMVDYAITIESKRERQAYARAIVQVMIGLHPKMKDEPDFRHKIWDHLALISNYKLDIDYPFKISNHDNDSNHPNKIDYPKAHIHFRHYGQLLEKALEELKEMPEGKERDEFIRIIANRMKRNLADWKGDGIQDEKVARDIEFYTDGKIKPDFSKKSNKLIKISDNRFRTRKNKGYI